MARFDLEPKEMERLIESMKEYEGNTETAVNEVLHEYAGPKIDESIRSILPVSGRKFKGKKKAASSTLPFTQEDGNVSVTVKTKYSYHYLYFPDDGSNTKRHAGNQQFMNRGADLVKTDIIDRCIGRLTEDFN